MRVPCLLLACVFLAVPAHAGLNDSRLGPGISAGLGGSMFGGADARRHTMRVGFEAGLVCDIELGRLLHVRPEAMVSMRGSRWDTVGALWETLVARSAETQLTYVDIPVFVALSAPFGWRVAPVVLAGAYAGFCVAADGLVETRVGSGSYRLVVVDIRDEVNTVDAGFSLGGGLHVPVAMGAVFLEARWQWGLVNVFAGSSAPQLRNSGFVVRIGYHF